jgi:hypothetical protein
MVQVLVGFVNSAAPDFQGNPQPPRLCLQAADDGGEGLALTRRHRRSRPGDSLQLGRGTKPRDRRCVSPGPRSWRTGEKARCCCHSTRSEKGGATVVRVTATAHPLISAPGLPARSPANRLRPNLRTLRAPLPREAGQSRPALPTRLAYAFFASELLSGAGARAFQRRWPICQWSPTIARSSTARSPSDGTGQASWSRFSITLSTAEQVGRSANFVRRKRPVCGAFSKPSDGLEPSTPSLPWRSSNQLS